MTSSLICPRNELSERYDNRPAWYILESLGWCSIIKHGTTYHLTNRKGPYNVHNPYEVKYKHILLLSESDLSSKYINLYQLDNILFPDWLKKQGLYDTHHFAGGGDEFYKQEDPVGIVRRFLDDMCINIVEELTEDPFPRNALHDTDVLLEEDKHINAVKALTPSISPALPRIEILDVTKENIEKIFVPNGMSLRKNQCELYDKFFRIVQENLSYKGIVQWPTGTGKTIGEIILILITYQIIKNSGKTYCGLLVCPRNTILNTQIKVLSLLSRFGIEVIEAHNGQFHTVTIPNDKHILIIVTHAALVHENKDDINNVITGMDSLPLINHLHYDELHHMTADKFLKSLLRKQIDWSTPYITATSATPKTSNTEQHRKLHEFFGVDLPIIHSVDIPTAVANVWIVPPRFEICEVPNDTEEKQVIAVVKKTKNIIERRQQIGMFECGKCIVYVNSVKEISIAVGIARDEFPKEWQIYWAAKIDGVENHNRFASKTDSPPDGTPRILFACDRYREGSDIEGLEFTGVLMGRQMAAYILIQIIGRALRTDYQGKEGWCCIFRPKYEDEEDTSILEKVLLDLEALITFNDGTATKVSVAAFIRTYFGEIEMNGRILNVDETIDRVQNMYLRRQLLANKITISEANRICKEHKIVDSAHYAELQQTVLTGLPTDPATYWANRGWVCWHDLLHGNERPVSLNSFKMLLDSKGIHSGEEWEHGHVEGYPTMQQISDGYYKPDNIIEFKDLFLGRRRR